VGIGSFTSLNGSSCVIDGQYFLIICLTLAVYGKNLVTKGRKFLFLLELLEYTLDILSL